MEEYTDADKYCIFLVKQIIMKRVFYSYRLLMYWVTNSAPVTRLELQNNTI